MSTLEQERSLLYDSDLHRKLSAVDRKAEGDVWATAAAAFNLRSMWHLAAELTERALKLHPRNDRIWWEYIHAVTLYTDKLQAAAERLEGMRKPPSERPVLLSLIDYYLERDAEGKSRLEDIPEEDYSARCHEVQGHYDMARGDYEAALRDYQKAKKLSPKDPRILYHIGRTYRTMGWLAHAEKWLYRSIRKERHCVQAWNSLCRIHLERQRNDLARQAMGNALAINPRDWGIYFTLADHHLNLGQVDRARAVLMDVLDLEPRRVIAAEIHNYLGYLLFHEDRYEEAVPRFKRALELNPQLSVALFNLGNIHYRRKDMDQAVKCYRKALKTDPRQSGAATQLGLAYLEQGKVDPARRPLERALKVDPGDYWAHLGLSEYHRRKRRPEKAVEHAEAALAIEPKNASVHNYLGIALEVSRRYYQAEAAYKKALRIDPTHRWAANNLGYLYEKLMRLDSSYHQAAINAWKTRLLICRDTGASTRGAENHLKKLGVAKSTVNKWLKTAQGPTKPQTSP